MKPRTRPTKVAITQKAIDETRNYGESQRYIPGILAAGEFWEVHAAPAGLPEDWDDRGTVTVYFGDEHINWKIYMQTVSGIRMAFAESENAETLILLMVVPARELKFRPALTEARKRI
jgi:hypothetical protein